MQPFWHGRAIHALLVVAINGSMTAAAQRLHYSIATISRWVTQLERAAGAPLVTRTGVGVELTADGQRVVERACPIMCAWEQIADAAIRTRPAPSCPSENVLPCLGLGACPGRPRVAGRPMRRTPK